MAVRIRKLARELGRSPVELIGVLHALGFQRYSSPEDMLPSAAEAKLRRGLTRGVAPEQVQVQAAAAAPTRRPPEAPAASPARNDFMAKVMSGVVPIGGASAREAWEAPVGAERTLSPAPERASVAPMVVEPAPSSRGAPDLGARALQVEREALDSLRRRLMSERAVVESERNALEDERRRVDARERGLEAEREALAGLRAALEAERQALDVERAVLSTDGARSQASQLVCLQDVLEARGLRGSDEFERALVSLAMGRHLRDVLWTIRLDPEEDLTRVLDERMVLVGGPVPTGLGKSLAVVEVAPERAELPAAAALERHLKELGERLLLNGLRRLTLIGGRPTWQRLLRERLDPRIEVRCIPGSMRTAHLAEADVVRTDAVVLWDVEMSAEARAVYASSRAVVVEVDDPGLTTFFKVVLARLEGA